MPSRTIRNAVGLAAPAVCAWLATACASSPWSGPEARLQADALRAALIGLHPSVDAGEAERLARAAVEQSSALTLEYRAVSPAWVHNFLVNGGLRARGLCYEWTNDLYARLRPLGCESLELRLAVARMDTLREHNGIVVIARGQRFEEGVVLDAWRDSGRLWFGSAKSDAYPWEPLPPDRVAPELRGLVQR